jgi:dipeptidyl-peptidase 4
LPLLSERYRRAAGLSAPKAAAATPGISVEGYWLDDESYFFLSEKFAPSIGRIVEIPSIADRTSGRVKEVISLEELRQQIADHAGRAVDLTALSTARFDMPDRDTIAVTVGGCDYRLDVRQRRITELSKSLEAPALYSPDGRYACFLKDADLWLRERETGFERPLTTDGAPYNAYGRQPESCMFALPYRKHPNPLALWSPDSQWLMTHRINERLVPDMALVEHVPSHGARPVLHRYKQPLPGDPLPVVTYVAIHVSSGRIVMFDEYPAPVLINSPIFRRMAWFGVQDTCWFIRLDRYYKQAELIELDLERGSGRVVISESATSGYLEFHQMGGTTPNVRTLARSNEVIWWSERDGWGHLYLYDAESRTLTNRITSGEWLVRDIIHVDEIARRILFTACGIDPKADPAWRSLCAINLDGSDFEVLSAHQGDLAVPKTEPCGITQERPFFPSRAQAGVSPNGRYAAVLYASIERGNVTKIVDLQTRRSLPIASALPAADEVSPRPITALAADGTTRLHGVLFLPSDFDESRRYPLIDYIYPGPQVTLEPQSFGSCWAAFSRALAELGFIVLMLDTRGMPFRSRALHQLGYGELLEPQLADHAAVVEELCKRHSYLDAGRVGMIGISGGGYATARALLDYGAVFKVGVSICGNHDNRLIVSSWRDKYCGPGADERWTRQANGAVAHKLNGKLLLISGDMDENVHLSQTFSLLDALIRANRDFDLLIVPGEGHYLLMTNGYVLRRAWDYFVRHLLGESPPAEFAIEFEPHEVARMERNYMRGML